MNMSKEIFIVFIVIIIVFFIVVYFSTNSMVKTAGWEIKEDHNPDRFSKRSADLQIKEYAFYEEMMRQGVFPSVFKKRFTEKFGYKNKLLFYSYEKAYKKETSNV